MTGNPRLPRNVMSFLKRMGPHKECLKWKIRENCHKVSLHLTWNFRSINNHYPSKRSLRQRFLQQLNKAFHIAQQRESEPRDSLPPDVRQALDTIPRRNRRVQTSKRLSNSFTNIRRALSQSSQSSMDRSLSRSSSRYGSYSNRLHQTSHYSSLSRSSSPYRTQSSSGYTRIRSHSASRIANPRDPRPRDKGSNSTRDRSQCMFDTSRSVDALDFRTSSKAIGAGLSTDISSIRISASGQHRSPYQQRTRITYRSESSFEHSLEDLMLQERKSTEEQLQVIKREWDEALLSWPYTSRPLKPRQSSITWCADSQPFQSAHSIRTNDQTSVGSTIPTEYVRQRTVNKCLDSCEKILGRYA